MLGRVVESPTSCPDRADRKSCEEHDEKRRDYFAYGTDVSDSMVYDVDVIVDHAV